MSAYSRSALWGTTLLVLGILLVLLSGFSMGLAYLDNGIVARASVVRLAAAVAVLAVGVIWNLALRRSVHTRTG